MTFKVVETDRALVLIGGQPKGGELCKDRGRYYYTDIAKMVKIPVSGKTLEEACENWKQRTSYADKILNKDPVTQSVKNENKETCKILSLSLFWNIKRVKGALSLEVTP